MSTRSAIMAELDGRCIGVYCHSDGYPEGVGATLLEHYTDEAKLRELLALGDLSSLDAEIGEKHAFSTLRRDLPEEQQIWTRAYHRDREEPWEDVKPDEKPTFEELYEWFREAVAYVYLWRGGEWLCTKTYGATVPKLRTIPALVVAEDEERAAEEAASV